MGDFPEISEQQLEDWLSGSDISDDKKILICLAANGCTPKTPTKIYLLGVNHGWRCFDLNGIASRLPVFTGLVIQKGAEYKFTSRGKEHAKALIAKLTDTPIENTTTSLIREYGKIKNEQIRVFVEEAVTNVRYGAFRSAVMLSWIGAIAILREEVVVNHLSPFNIEAKRVLQKWKDAKNWDDLGKMQEKDFLIVICNIGMIEKNVKQELEKALSLRNGCGHPSKVAPGKSRVEAHVEDLVTYVYSRFGRS